MRRATCRSAKSSCCSARAFSSGTAVGRRSSCSRRRSFRGFGSPNISSLARLSRRPMAQTENGGRRRVSSLWRSLRQSIAGGISTAKRRDGRSEEHTSELQSHSDLVCRLLLEKKKKKIKICEKTKIVNDT